MSFSSLKVGKTCNITIISKKRYCKVTSCLIWKLIRFTLNGICLCLYFNMNSLLFYMMSYCVHSYHGRKCKGPNKPFLQIPMGLSPFEISSLPISQVKEESHHLISFSSWGPALSAFPRLLHTVIKCKSNTPGKFWKCTFFLEERLKSFPQSNAYQVTVLEVYRGLHTFGSFTTTTCWVLHQWL